MSTDRQPPPRGGGRLEQSTVLADSRQRRILSILLGRSHPMTERELSVQLVARETGTDPADITEENHQSVRISLHHQYLPKLESAGWVEWHEEGVVAAEPLPGSDEDVSPATLLDPDHPDWDAVSALLVRPQRQDLVSVIAGGRDQLTLEELVITLTEHSHASWPAEQRGDEPALRSTLHHVDLPKLAAVGLLEYDPDEQTITRTQALETLVDRLDLDDRVPDASEAN